MSLLGNISASFPRRTWQREVLPHLVWWEKWDFSFSPLSLHRKSGKNDWGISVLCRKTKGSVSGAVRICHHSLPKPHHHPKLEWPPDGVAARISGKGDENLYKQTKNWNSALVMLWLWPQLFPHHISLTVFEGGFAAKPFFAVIYLYSNIDTLPYTILFNITWGTKSWNS